MICIDAGHGRSNRKLGLYDPGATACHDGYFYEEAQIALEYARTLKYFLSEQGLKCCLTRLSADTSRPLQSRAAYARAQGATHLISLHLNASLNRWAKGVETLYARDEQREFAQALQQAVVEASGFQDRGLKKRANLAVLQFEGPAALIELGFITNKANCLALTRYETRITICRALAETLVKMCPRDTEESQHGG